MKNLLLFLLVLIASNCFAKNYYQHHSKETIQQNYSFDYSSTDNTLYIHNIDGFIQVEGYGGDKISVEINRTTSGKSKSDLQLGLHEAQLKVVNHKNQIHFFIKTPYTSLIDEEGQLKFKEQNHNNHNQYMYKLNYTIKVPKHTNLNLTTYNDGFIQINNVQANKINAYNINGEVHLEKVAGLMDIKTINGDISLSYYDKNLKNSQFESINGSFDVMFVEKPNIEILYETMNGDFYSNIELSSVSTVIKKSVKQKMSGVKYKLKPQKKVTIGPASNTKFTFKTLNGDIKLTKKV